MLYQWCVEFLNEMYCIQNLRKWTVYVRENLHYIFFFQEGTEKIEYRVWNPFRSKLAAAIVGGVGNIYMPPGCKVLYLGAANGTTVSHVSDVIGPVSCCEGWVYLVKEGSNVCVYRHLIIILITTETHCLALTILCYLSNPILSCTNRGDYHCYRKVWCMPLSSPCGLAVTW